MYTVKVSYHALLALVGNELWDFFTGNKQQLEHRYQPWFVLSICKCTLFQSCYLLHNIDFPSIILTYKLNQHHLVINNIYFVKNWSINNCFLSVSCHNPLSCSCSAFLYLVLLLALFLLPIYSRIIKACIQKKKVFCQSFNCYRTMS